MLVFFGQISSQPPKKLILAQQPPWVLEEMYGFRDFHRKWAFLSEADCQMCATWSSGSRQVVCFFRGKTSCTQEHSTSEVVCSSVWAWHPSGVPLTIVVLDLAGDQQPCAHHCLQPGICGVQFGEMGFQPTDYRKCDKTCGEMKTFILKHVHHIWEGQNESTCKLSQAFQTKTTFSSLARIVQSGSCLSSHDACIPIPDISWFQIGVRWMNS